MQVFEGKDVIKQGRAMIGATNPLQAQAGSIRFVFSGLLCLLY
jgi:nucleoside-diphosphate kinase